MSDPQKKRRKHYFIDPKLQGRYLLSFGIPMIVMLGFMLATVYFATETAVDSASHILRRNIEGTIALELQDQQTPSVERYQAVLTDIAQYAGSFSQNRAMRKDLMPTLLLIFGVGLLVVIIQILFLTVYFSHRIAGPVYRFGRAFASIAEGDFTREIHLRKSDEMQQLADQFNEALRSIRQRLSTLTGGTNGQGKQATTGI